MAQQDAAAVATGADSSPVALTLTTADIKSMSLSSTGGLIITKADGSTLIVENFKEMAEHRARLTLANGETIDAEKLFETLSAGQSFSTPDVITNPAIVITGPQPATALSFTLEEGQLYVFEFDPKAQDAHIENGAMILTFANGGTVILNNYEHALTSSNPPALTIADGAVVDGIGLLDFARARQDETGHDQAEIRRGEQEENLATLAQDLAKVEPAAGESGSGAGSRGGFGFQSAVDDAPLGSPAPIGPIGPTALQFGLPQFDERVYAESEPSPEILPPGKPGLETEDVFVDEDGSVLLNLSVSSNGVPNVNTTATVSGIPAGWTVDAGLGTYDPAAGTWTIVL
ncbi:MAG: hemolysin, partial [Micavibrio aeruginosavorus]|nr:hemolysin [Micavibrio aeruginosavorus]